MQILIVLFLNVADAFFVERNHLLNSLLQCLHILRNLSFEQVVDDSEVCAVCDVTDGSYNLQLCGTLVDREDTCIAIQSLALIFHYETRTTVYLDGIVSILVGIFRVDTLCDRSHGVGKTCVLLHLCTFFACELAFARDIFESLVEVYVAGCLVKYAAEKAVAMIEPRTLDTLLHPQFDPEALKKIESVGKALAASPGAAAGKIVFTAEDAKEWAARGEKVVLVRLETSPEDIEGMKAAQGILTVRGGMTSHAAVVARGMGTCCVSGCTEMAMDEENKKFVLGGKTYHEGDELSLDGSTGKIYDGIIPTKEAEIAGEFGRIMGWADKYRRMHVRTNADTPRDAKKARELGAEGIGLCRTEHMFFEESRIGTFREMICSDTKEERETALNKILPLQRADFEALYTAMEGYPVTIRFLDPPLHEFVPTTEPEIEALAAAKGKTVAEIKDVIASLHESNPMMGHRGCRLSVTYPEIAAMQTKAVIQAALNVKKEHANWNIVPEIMIPLVGDVKELAYVKNVVVETADAEIAKAGVELKYEVGTMIEIPRACLTADEIAKEAAFFCFGTNDLTQMTFGFSRDDAGKFLGAYYDNKIYESDPFAKLDQNGVGKLMQMAAKLGKSVRPEMHLGICGEHGGDPVSVEFCNKIGLDYVSCSPFRVPIARLAAAQAAIKEM